MSETVWIVWLAAIVASFAVFEGYALRHHDRKGTLSWFMWNLGQRWPLSLVLFGMLFGGLAVHFYWQWCPS